MIEACHSEAPFYGAEKSLGRQVFSERFFDYGLKASAQNDRRAARAVRRQQATALHLGRCFGFALHDRHVFAAARQGHQSEALGDSLFDLILQGAGP